jgi:hypothetical protein
MANFVRGLTPQLRRSLLFSDLWMNCPKLLEALKRDLVGILEGLFGEKFGIVGADVREE